MRPDRELSDNANSRKSGHSGGASARNSRARNSGGTCRSCAEYLYISGWAHLLHLPGQLDSANQVPPAGVQGVEAIVADGTGNELATIGYGFITGCTAGPTNRVVFDQAPVPGMTAAGGTVPVFGFPWNPIRTAMTTAWD